MRQASYAVAFAILLLGAAALWLAPSGAVASSTLSTFQSHPWDDLRVSLERTLPASSAPTFTIFLDDLKCYSFAQGEGLHLSVQMPHSWQEGTSICPHIHLGCADTTSGTAVFLLDYSVQSIGGGAFPAQTTISGSHTFAAPVTAKSHVMLDLGTIDMTGHTISAMLICLLRRGEGGDGDDLGAEVFVYEFDVHYRRDAPGSRREGSK